MNTRMMHIFSDNIDDYLYAGDHRGVLYKLTKDIEVESFSHKPANSTGLHVIVGDDAHLYARDTSGNLIIFDRKSLKEKRFIVSDYFRSNEADVYRTPVPTPSNGLKLYKDKLIMSNSLGELCVFNKDTLELNEVLTFNKESFNESINTDAEQHFISDCLGYIWSGSFEDGNFKKVNRIDHGNVHRIIFDQLHHRYIATTDTYNGICVFDDQGKVIDRVSMTNDDVEWVAFSNDYKLLYIACFDHYLYVYNNEDKIKLIKKIGPFKFQLKQVLVDKEDQVFVLLESGEIIRINADEKDLSQSRFGTNAAWYIDSIPGENNKYLCALESGEVGMLSTDGNHLNLERLTDDFKFGRIRRALPIGRNEFIAISTSGCVFKADISNQISWTFKHNSILRDISLSPDKKIVSVCTEGGFLILINAETGEKIKEKQFDKPLWALLYISNTEILLGTRSSCINSDSVISAPETVSYLYKINVDDLSIVDSIKADGNFKRFRQLEKQRVLVNGNGSILVRILDLEKFKFLDYYQEWLLNTPEDAIVNGDYVYASTYGYQINTYDRASHKIVDSQFTTEDYPKTLALNSNQDRLLVGGRGFISLYDVSSGIPGLIQTLII